MFLMVHSKSLIMGNDKFSGIVNPHSRLRITKSSDFTSKMNLGLLKRMKRDDLQASLRMRWQHTKHLQNHNAKRNI